MPLYNPAGGAAIGSPITGGHLVGNILYLDESGNLSQLDTFKFDGTDLSVPHDIHLTGSLPVIYGPSLSMIQFDLGGGNGIRLWHESNRLQLDDTELRFYRASIGTDIFNVANNGTVTLNGAGQIKSVANGTAAQDAVTLAQLKGLAYCYLSLTSDHTGYNSGTEADISWDAASPNVGSMWSSGANVTIPTTGWYRIELYVVGGTVTQISAAIYNNGSAIRVNSRLDTNAFGNSNLQIAYEGPLTAADVIKATYYRTLGGAGNDTLYKTAEGGCHLMVRQIW